MEFPDEFKIYLYETSSSLRLYGEPIPESVSKFNSKNNIEKIFEETVTDYMIEVFWNELDYALMDGGGHNFLRKKHFCV